MGGSLCLQDRPSLHHRASHRATRPDNEHVQRSGDIPEHCPHDSLVAAASRRQTGPMIRPGAQTDWPAIERLLRAMGFTEGQSSEQLRLRFYELIRRTDHFVCVSENAGLIAYAWAQDLGPHLRSGNATVRLHDLWVDEQARRRGVGRELFESVREWARARPARWLQWQASASAVPFYAALGISPTPSEDNAHSFFEIDFG
jgi:GNAT superfamily N-acetyltransferase